MNESIITVFWPLFFSLLTMLIFIAIYCNRAQIANSFRKVSVKVWIILALLVLIGLSARIIIPPWSHLDFFNDWSYAATAEELVHNGRFGLCNWGNLETCMKYSAPPNQIAYSFFSSIFVFFLGKGFMQMQLLNFTCGLLNIVLIFCFGYLFSKKEYVGLFAAAFYAVFPLEVLFSTTLAPETFYVTFMLMALIALLIFIETNALRIFALFAFLFSAIIQNRNEAQMWIFLMPFLLLLLKPATITNLFKKKVPLLWISFGMIMLSEFFSLWYIWNISRQQGLNALQNAFSVFQSIWNNYYIILLQSNLSLLAAFLVIIGVFALFAYYRKNAWFLILWFCFTIIIYGLYPMKSERFLIPFIPVIAVIFGMGVDAIMNYFSSDKNKLIVNSVLLCLIIISFYPFINNISQKSSYELQHEQYIKFISKFQEFGVSKDSIIITNCPYLINYEIGLYSINMGDYREIAYLLQKNISIYFWEDVFCFYPQTSAPCSQFKEAYQLKLVQKEGDISALYRVEKVKT